MTIPDKLPVNNRVFKCCANGPKISQRTRTESDEIVDYKIYCRKCGISWRDKLLWGGIIEWNEMLDFCGLIYAG